MSRESQKSQSTFYPSPSFYPLFGPKKLTTCKSGSINAWVHFENVLNYNVQVYTLKLIFFFWLSSNFSPQKINFLSTFQTENNEIGRDFW